MVRVEAKSIQTPLGLYNGLTANGLEPKIASRLARHEKLHADADPERNGEFGFVLTSGYVVAYYLILGERTPEQLMKIASAPSDMSEKDKKIYKDAWNDHIREIEEKRFKPIQAKEPDSYESLREVLINILADKLNQRVDEGEFLGLEEVLGIEFVELLDKFGPLLQKAFEESVDQVRDEYDISNIFSPVVENSKSVIY